MRHVLYTKASRWNYEREWRAFVQLGAKEWIAEANRNMYFLEFSRGLPPAEVILGMACTATPRTCAGSWGSIRQPLL